MPYSRKKGSRVGIVYRLISRYIDPATSADIPSEAARIRARAAGVSLPRCSFELLEQTFQAPSHFLALWTHFSQLSGNSNLTYLTHRMPAQKLLLDGASRWPWSLWGLLLPAMALRSLVSQLL